MSQDCNTANNGTMPWRLTEDVETAVGLKLADAFVMRLEWACGTVGRSDAQRLRVALVRLKRERPELHTAVVLMAEPKATVRSVAPALGVSPKTVCIRRNKGLTKLRQWCQDDNPPQTDVA